MEGGGTKLLMKAMEVLGAIVVLRTYIIYNPNRRRLVREGETDVKNSKKKKKQRHFTEEYSRPEPYNSSSGRRGSRRHRWCVR